jgi:hypothetical protein
MTLNDGCFEPRTVMHEAIHAAGIPHEQSRPDRDYHVEIVWDNIQPGNYSNKHNFTLPVIFLFF